jgi:hypothetical protein
LPSGQAHDDGRHHDSVIDPNYDALELVPCAESHCRDANWPGCGFRRSVSAPQSL